MRQAPVFLVIGITTVDFFVSGLHAQARFGGDEFTPENLTFCAQPVTMVLGGNGANTAYVLARLGAPVALCSKIGQDEPGGMARQWLAAQHVNLAALTYSAGYATATNAVITGADLSRLSFFYPGASDDIGLADLQPGLLAASEGVFISGYTLLPALRPAGFHAVLAQARQMGKRTALDIGPAIGSPARIEELEPLLPLVDYLFANAYELAVCTAADTPAAGAAILLNAGVGCVVIKQGEAGATVYTSGASATLPGIPVQAQFTVGAGDSFDAGFLFAIRQGSDPASAARLANAVAARVVASSRGVLGSPTLAEVTELVEQSYGPL